MFGLRMGAMGRVGAGLTLTQQAINILRRPGLESHVYMPGVGWVNGFSLTNTIMEDGTQAASVDNPVGYMGDPIATVGPETNPNPNFSTFTGAYPTGWGGTENNTTTFVEPGAGGGVRIRTTDGSLVNTFVSGGTVTVGRTYQATLVVSAVAAGTLNIRNGGGTITYFSTSTPGTYSFVFTGPTDGAYQIIRGAAGVPADFTVASLSVRELVGAIPARQATTANKPILRRGAVNRLLQTGFTGGTDGTVGAGAVAPTGWTFGFSGGTVAYVPAASGQGNAIRFVATAGRPMIQQNYSVLASMTYLLHMRVDAVVGSVRADIAAGFGGLPAGATQTWRVNGVVGGATLLQAGDRLEVLLAIGATAGTVQPRIGLGAVGSATGDITLANPQLETGSTASPYIPTTTAAASSPTGPYWMEFDGTDFLSLAAVPFQQADDHAVGVAAFFNTYADTYAFAIRNSASTNAIVASLRVNTSGLAQCLWRDDVSVTVAPSASGAVGLGTTFVMSAAKVGGTRSVRRNLGTSVSDSTVLGASTVNTATLGASVSTTTTGQLNGGLFGAYVIKGTTTQAERDILDRWLAQGAQLTL